MRNPLNDIEVFAAVTAGAGGMSGFAACVTVGYPFSSDFAAASVVILAVSGAAALLNRVIRHISPEKETEEDDGRRNN